MKMILDLDTGIDDALALAYAVGSPEIELLGIVGSYGNVLTETGVKNTLALLKLLGQPGIPVYSGNRHALFSKDFEVSEISAFIHGKNGIGEVLLSEPEASVKKQEGVDFIIDMVKTCPGEVVIVPTGPLTNLAAAFQKAPEIIGMTGRVVLMGGALIIPGNVTPYAEANISQDPEAAKYVFESGVNLVMVGLDVTHRTLLTKRETERWRRLGTAAGRAYANIVDYYINAYETTSPHLGGCALHDPLAVAIALEPELAETIRLYMTVETGEGQRGRTIGNKERINDPEPSTEVCVNVDSEKFLDAFMSRLTKLFRMEV